MEWVETTGRTVEEAKEAALDELGVDETEAEFEILSEPRPGLFGRLRAEARVRARVKPTAPRAKDDRRDRRRRGGRSGSTRPPATAPTEEAAGNGSPELVPVGAPAEPGSPGSSGSAASPGSPGSTGSTGSTGGDGSAARKRSRRRRSGSGGSAGSGRSAGARAGANGDDAEEGAGVEVDLAEQGRVAEEFLAQLLTEFGVSGSVTVSQPDEETVELRLNGSDLGILIGPKGATLLAIQNLVRNVVHHQTGANNGHINVDVGGYRQKRTEALVRFATQIASSVQQSGVRTAMEPMSAVDRKVVHDTIAAMDGVSTVSEGEEPRRRVVVLPAGEGSPAPAPEPAANEA